MEGDNFVSVANNTSDHGLNTVAVLASFILRNYHHIYNVESALGLDSESVCLHLVNNRGRTENTKNISAL
jgi:hypothetical protein